MRSERDGDDGFEAGDPGGDFAGGRSGVVCEPGADGGSRRTGDRGAGETVYEAGRGMLRGVIQPGPAMARVLFDITNLAARACETGRERWGGEPARLTRSRARSDAG